MNLHLPQAALWDMDGTIIDTERYWIDAARALIEHSGQALPVADEARFIGASMSETAALVSRRGVAGSESELIATLGEAVRARIAADGLPWRPGAIHLLRELDAHEVPQALVTMSYATNTAELVDGLAEHGVRPFATMVTGDVVRHGKPHPEPYLIATERLGVRPQQCIAFEDSVVGATSARRAGVPTVLIPSAEQPGAADFPVCWATLDGATVHDVAALWSAASQGSAAAR